MHVEMLKWNIYVLILWIFIQIQKYKRMDANNLWLAFKCKSFDLKVLRFVDVSRAELKFEGLRWGGGGLAVRERQVNVED